ncbi:MAG TPA: OsmC family protein [Desulfobacterales bacterium]|jgi:organic hydroperoxide reductase OsmC/OhrA|nr:OsmC family protein [Desulfobacterales bacterium]
MMGTLATVLAGKKIKTFKGLFEAVVTGDIEDVNGVLKITRINVSYWLKVPKDKRAEAKEALETYLPLCPGAQSVIGCIDINHELTMEDLNE